MNSLLILQGADDLNILCNFYYTQVIYNANDGYIKKNSSLIFLHHVLLLRILSQHRLNYFPYTSTSYTKNTFLRPDQGGKTSRRLPTLLRNPLNVFLKELSLGLEKNMKSYLSIITYMSIQVYIICIVLCI